MIDPAAFREQELVCVTSEDDAVDDLSIRMEHARRLRTSLLDVDPSTLVVHPCGNLVTLIVRPSDGGRGFTIGTTMARRFETDPPDAAARAAMLRTVLVALDRYGTIDPRQAELERRADAVLTCVLSEQSALMPDLEIEQGVLALPCPWSPMQAGFGGWEGDEWREPSVEAPEGADAHLPCAVDLSIEADGRVTIRAWTFEWLSGDRGRARPVDAMTRLRLQSGILRSERFPPHPRPGRG